MIPDNKTHTAPHRGRRAPRPVATAVVILLAGALGAACGTTTRGSVTTTARSGAHSTSTTKAPSRTGSGATTTSTTPPSQGTRIIAYEPYSAKGTIDPTLRVTKTVTGSCQAAGVAGNSSFRCFAQPSSTIYDPCFAPPGATTGPLLCPSPDPASSGVIRFDVGPLPSPLSGAPQARPWAMQLSSGEVCVLVNAAWGGLGPFGCQVTPIGMVADCHVPQQSTPLWTAQCQLQQTDASPFTPYEVDTIWS
jgi:hypothetical protein